MKSVECRRKGVRPKRSRERCVLKTSCGVKTSAKFSAAGDREEDPVVLKQVAQAILHLLFSSFYRGGGRLGANECCVCP
jgi:hypothetical protein